MNSSSHETSRLSRQLWARYVLALLAWARAGEQEGLLRRLPWTAAAGLLLGLLNRFKSVAAVLLAANAGGMLRRSKSRQAVKKALGIVGLPGVETYYPAELSIGECRRVELARALINSPPLLLLDELTANLDDDNIWDLMHLLNELNTRGTTIVMATHASQYVNIMRRRVVTLVDGKLAGDVQHGKYGDIV